MNHNSFYKGILAELYKTAQANPVFKKKTDWSKWVLPAMGFGAAGLGAGLLYNKLKGGTSASPVKSAIPESTPTSATPTFDATEPKASILDKSTNAAYGGGLLGTTLAALKGKANQAFGFGDTLFGAKNIVDSLRNPDNLNTGTRVTQGIGGAAQSVLGGLGIANKTIPKSVTMFAGRGAGSLAAVPTAAAAAVQQTLSTGGQAAEEHSAYFASKNGPVDDLANASKLLHSGDPKLVGLAKQYIQTLSNSPKTLNSVTNPGTLARIGYNPVPNNWANPLEYLRMPPKPNPAAWYNSKAYLNDMKEMYNPMSYLKARDNQDPEFGTYNHIFEMLRRKAQSM